MERKVEELIARWESSKTERVQYEKAWDEILRLFLPFRDDITTARAKGDTRIRGVFETTGVFAADRFSNFLTGAIVPSGSDWLKLRIQGEFAEDISVRRLLDKVAEKVLWRLADSNFYTQIAVFLRDFAVLGSACMSQTDKIDRNGRWKGFNFDAVPLGDVWWEVGVEGAPFILFRSRKMAAIDALRFFGDDAGPYINQAARMGAMTPVYVLHVVYENEDGKPGGISGSVEKNWISEWISLPESSATGQAHSMRSGGFDHCPYTVGRWEVVNGESYGRGRGHLARPDARGINELKRQVLIAAGRDLNPPLMVEHKGMVKMDILPDSIMVVKPPSKMAPNFLRSGTDYQAANLIATEDRKQIERAFMLDQLGTPETQPRSAFESRRQELRAMQSLGNVAQRVDKEVMRPLTVSAIEGMEKQRLLPELKQIREITGEDPMIVFQSPFFTAQKQSGMQKVDAALERRLRLFGVTQDPIWIDDISPDKITAYERRVADLPAEIFEDEDKVAAKRRKREETERLQRQLLAQQAEGGGGNGNPDALNPPRAGNPPPQQEEVRAL